MIRLAVAGVAGLFALPLLALAGPPPQPAVVPIPGGSDSDQVTAAPAALRAAIIDAAEATALPPAFLTAVLLQPPAATGSTPGGLVPRLARDLLDAGRLPGGGWDARQALAASGRSAVAAEILDRAAQDGYRYSPAAPPLDPQRYVFPVAGPVTFGSEHHDYPATDIFTTIGTPVIACVRSEILRLTPVERGKGGITITLRGEDGWRYYYAHLHRLRPLLRPGQVVERGTVLGWSGNTGNARSTPPHLHFGISRNGPVAGELSPYRYLTDWPKLATSEGEPR